MQASRWLIIFLIIIPLCFSGIPTAPSAQDSLLRLHVRANSDSPTDQAIKYQVRDTVLATLDGHLQNAGNATIAQEEIAQALPEVLRAARQTVAAAGFDYEVTASLGTAQFPTRMYGDQVYRAGTYQALQIYLGDGEGQNWWCVLFPPLCFVAAKTTSENDPVPVVATPEQAIPPCRSRILEWWQRLIGKL
ncbi:MAG: stage II sporulation protein R [Firmicutes bacterium]|nr:stage II sporulation protein R [Bacillota bacterium]